MLINAKVKVSKYIKGSGGMYLKKIEIQGFKSFADKTEIEFKNEVTAIVGPNGSGKSNISDAIRWVLGEQSIKNLRGNKMEDIIFSGTDKRKALGYAEVTLTLDNSDQALPIDYREVAVCRRMFRSGESEYYINKNSCRLKDIKELFMDSGIGKDGYSIIGQGRIDEILSNKPEERRNIFEEAAGITKYKSKKEEAVRKLEKTEVNLTRINDLIYEISNQKDSLELEAKKAIEFKKYFSRLRDLEVNLFVRNIRKLEKQISDIKIEEEKLYDDLKILEDEKNLIESEFNKNKKYIQEIELQIEENRTIKFDTIQAYEKNKNQITLINEKENYLNKDLDRLEKEKDSLINELKQIENIKSTVNNELEVVNNNLEKLESEYKLKCLELENLNKDLRILEIELDNSNKVLNDNYNLYSDKKSQINSIDTFNSSMDKRLEKLYSEIKKSENRKTLLNRDLETLCLKELSLKTSLEDDKNNLKIIYLKKNDIEKEYEEISNSIKDYQIQLNGLKSSLNLYKNMEIAYEGYYKSVKGLLQGTNKDNDLRKGLIGIVADLLKVDTKYERAIDISLGSNIQNLVVESEIDAKKFVHYLKTNKLGRATFLPLDTIKGKTINLKSDDKNEFNILGLAHELIDYDARYNNIFEFLLGRTIIVKNIDDGIRLANKYKHMHRIVTLDGEVFNSGGSITGGSSGKESINIISRKNKINNLIKDINTINVDLSKLEKASQEILKTLALTKDKIDSIESNIKFVENNIAENKNEQTSIRFEIIGIDNSIISKELEIENLNKELKNYNIGKEKLKKDLSNLEGDIENLNEEITIKDNLIAQFKEQINELNKNIIETNICINKTHSIKESLDTKLQNYMIDNEEINNSILEHNNSILKIKEDLNNLAVQKERIINEIASYENSEDEITVNLNELIKNKDTVSKKFYDDQDRLKTLNKRILEYEKKINNIKVKITRFEMRIDNFSSRLMDDYELTIEEALKFQIVLDNIQNIQAETKELKESIKNLGNVNISAIEEFKNVSNRYEFLTTQQSDLIKAKEDLIEIIKDMEGKMKSQFFTSLKEINTNFNEVFSVLFNGGKARIELENEEDILSSGIEIIIQPPGKKLQSLSLLSGGEKALTAVALLFAILQTKPSPFCVLDEIDAALDEANINRYTKFLKDFTDTTQFILITHRKSTMEIADILYGITMEEEGISKLISVKLKDNLIEAS